MNQSRMAAVSVVTTLGLLATLPPASAAGEQNRTETSSEDTPIFQGIVHAGKVPVAGATVRIQATPTATTTDSAGRFMLKGPTVDRPLVLTASAPGFFIGGGHEHQPGDRDIEIELEVHAVTDHADYAWVSAFTEAGDDQNCQNCHDGAGPSRPGLPFAQWRDDAHAGAARNTRFLTMYLGTDIHGNRSPVTRYRQDRDYGKAPIRPPTDQPYYGPGYRLDFPTTAGNCAACHAPMAAIDDPYGVDPSRLTDVALEGIGCDFCHKVADVTLDPVTGLPFPNRPGVLSYEFRRPPPQRQFFAGPFDDVAPGEDVHAPVYSESRYCAPCHQAEFWGVEIYGSYGEWLRSPYSEPGSGSTCQDCHMPTGANDRVAGLDRGGKRRDPQAVSSHRMPGAADEALLRDAVTMTATARLRDHAIEVRVEIENDGTGHHVPTDSPLRQMILVVRATDDGGHALPQVDGPTLPDWCGEGDPEQGYLAGLPGIAYAKILEELWTGVSPTGAYWNHTRIVSDNRIAAYESDTTTYAFAVPPRGTTAVSVQLLYRRAFIELRDRKGWGDTDIEMARQTLTVSTHADQALIPDGSVSRR